MIVSSTKGKLVELLLIYIYHLHMHPSPIRAHEENLQVVSCMYGR